MSLKSICGATLLAVLANVAPSAAATNIVINDSFEDGDNGWQFYAWGPLQVPNADIVPFDGNWVASTSCNYICPMIQTLPTVAGQAYNLSFAFNPGDYNAGADLKVYWGDTLVKDVLGGSLGWQTFSVGGLVAPTSSTDLTFSAIKDDGRVGLDAVSVSGVPEPATWTLLILGFGMVGTLLRSNRSRILAGLA